jgi:pimeloyl-ACP methyl ester carboxylesterase
MDIRKMPLTALIRSKFAEFSHTATVPLRDGQALKVRVFGSSMGQPVLILSGLGMSASHWLPMIVPFANQYRFYLPDFRGFGQSVKLSFNQADVFQNHMEDIQDVIAYLKLKDILLIGYSLGATTAMHLQRAGQLEAVKCYLHIDQDPCIRNQLDWTYGLLGEQQEVLFKHLKEADMLLAQHPKATYLRDIPFAKLSEVVTQIQQIRAKLNGHADVKAWHKTIILGM